ncbi:polyhydroxyalkanoic acid system family protein [uncultured Sphingomonas sp.]|uniref:polyhydroxyalkanoic acid system family protein n=1 Tax=uncultured Sphingomonas sp. TaxID=158754 RepID=UPI00263285FF|nr:polyhydroxyalkanoic acid system family protein [uncultured Sphingomonas sp.]
MSAPTVIEIPHQLGRDEVRRRMSSRVGDLAKRIPGGMAEVTSSWASEDRMLLDVVAMGQKVSATVDVEERLVRVSVALPLMLSFMSGPITAMVRKSGEDLLLADDARK